MKQYKPYPAYKASGIDWLGEIPEHWELIANKYIFNLKKQLVGEEHARYELLSLTLKGIIKRNLKELKGKYPAEFDSYQEVSSGDFIFCLFDVEETPRTIGLSSYNGMITGAYDVMSNYSNYSKHFLLYIYLHLDTGKRMRKLYKGLRNTIPKNSFMSFKLGVPPLQEQLAIAEFLDHKTREIDEFVTLKEQEIDLLKERKTAIVNQAVTRGLDSQVLMKDSGIPWLGEVPAHWKTLSIKRLAAKGRRTFTDGDWIESPYITNSGVRLIQTGNVGKGIYKEKGFRYISEDTFHDFKCTELFPKDVLICRLDGPVGRACEVPNLGVRMITSVDNTILKVDNGILSTYIVYLMTSSLWLEWIQSLCRAGGGFRFRISRSALGNLSVPVPPFDEQKSISKFLETELARIDQAISQAQKEINLIREYRQRLISDAVTGMIDVRGWKPATKEYTEPAIEPLMAAEPEVSYGKSNAKA